MIGDQKSLESDNIFVDIFFNTRQNWTKFEADTPQNFTKFVYVMLLSVKWVLLTLLTSKLFFSGNRFTQGIKRILKTIVFWWYMCLTYFLDLKSFKRTEIFYITKSCVENEYYVNRGGFIEN